MSVYAVNIEMHCPSTNSRGWHRRRLHKMVNSVFRCLAFTDPTGMVDVQIFTKIQTDAVAGVDTYFLDLLVDLPNDKLQDFVRYAKEVKYFHNVFHTNHFDTHPEPDTIHA